MLYAKMAFRLSRKLQDKMEKAAPRLRGDPRGVAEANAAMMPAPLETRSIRGRQTRTGPGYQGTHVAVARCDTLTASLALGDVVALNYANATTPGGRYLHGGRAQEEDLCRCCPELHPSLAACGHYPLAPDAALLTRDVRCLRQPATYAEASLGALDVITAAMPCGACDARPRGGWLQSPWADDVRARVRAVFEAAVASGRRHLVLGAWGCGAFGNPVKAVAALFAEVMTEYAGCFSAVVYAIVDPAGQGCLRPFREEMHARLGALAGARATSSI